MERTNNYNDLKPFRFWCQKVLPLVYDDSLSYYELLDKVIDYLNKTMEDVTVLNDDTEALYAAYNQLQSYVNNYFDNLDVQDEINAKLDQMAINGTLSSLINPQIPGAVSAWLSANVDPVGSAVVVDSTLTISGAAADAAVVGHELSGKQDTLVFDNTPTAGSGNPVRSYGIKNYVDGATNNLRQLMQSELSGKQDILVFDNTPTADSANPVRSSGIKNYVDVAASDLEDEITDLKGDISELIEGGIGNNTALYGKKLSILGDSISTYTGYLTPNSNPSYYPYCQGSPNADISSVDETWWKILLNKSGMVLGANNSYSGRTLIASATIENVQALGTNGTPDIILVYVGTNDANQQTTLGQIDKSVPFNVDPSETYGETLGTNLTQAQVEVLQTTDFYTSVRTLIIRLQWYYPNAKIVFLTIGWGSYERFFADNPYREALIECCELLGVDTIDIRKAGIHMPKFTDYTLQRVHPNKAGMKVIGEYVYNKLVSLFGAVDDVRDAVLDSLSYSGALIKTQYINGENFSPEGLTFTANFSNGTTRTVPYENISFNPEPLTTGTTSVIASYTYGAKTKTCIIDGISVEGEIQTITTSANYTFNVMTSFASMTYNYNGSILGLTNSIDKAYYENNPGRSAPYINKSSQSPSINGEVLAVSGGETIHFTVPSVFTALQWTLFELDENLSVIPTGMYANAWLSNDYTLTADTRYILVAFKVNNGSGTQTDEMLTALKGALSISGS